MSFYALFLCLFLSAAVHAAPACRQRSTSSPVTAAQLIQFAPQSVSCNATAEFADECRNATQAAPFINQGFAQFGIDSAGEKAALLSLMAFETNDFQFDRNHFPAPGRPGQGTRNLMMYPFVLDYALDTPSVAAQAQVVSQGKNGTDPTVSDDTKNAVLALVLVDDLSFASAMWFYKRSGPQKTGCAANATIVQGLQSQTRAGWELFITSCIFTTVTDDRASVWENAIAALQ
jgi:hypothetical protein